ncbi:Fic family protein [Spirosoma knui]
MPTATVPDELPLPELNWGRFVTLIGKANAALARYDGILQSIPNTDILLSPLTTQEAVLSSQIEGTQATLEEVLRYDADPHIKVDNVEDIREVVNYRRTLQHANKRLTEDDFPLSLRLIREMHKLLLSSVRGQHRDPGEFRRIQNWIGKPGSTINTARYVPPAPDEMQKALNNFELYLHFNDLDALVQLAIVHAQFEIIHPFLDGNGRIGRLLIPLFLFYKEVLSSPMFYISAYFESDRKTYYDQLLAITEHNDWGGWIEFFLNALIVQSEKNRDKAKAILQLYDTMKIKVVEVTRSQFAIQILDFLFNRPIFSSTDFLEQTNIPETSIRRLLKALTEADVLRILEVGSGRRSTIYYYEDLLAITRIK